ncbi:sphingomyelin phosphodiesterase [Sinomicrobium sp. M5D2P9]
MRKLNYGFYALLLLLLFTNSCSPDQIWQGAGSEETTSLIEEGGGEAPVRVLSYNVYLLTEAIALASSQSWSQEERASRLGKAGFIKNYDVLLLQECFDKPATKVLCENLSGTHPYQTPVLGTSNNEWDATYNLTDDKWFNIENGGVMIASKHPVEHMEQYVFSPGYCGPDAFSNKGFVYARILKDGQRMHFIVTHMQNTDPLCMGGEKTHRRNQLKEIKSYIDSRNIPVDEMVIIGGDFNILEEDTEEYNMMLQILNVSPPSYKGLPYTLDSKTNSLRSYLYPYPENERERIDYIFVSNDHLVPPSWQNVVFDPVSTTLMNHSHLSIDVKKDYFVDFSDHYPVEGSFYSDASTPKASMKTRKYDRMSLKAVSTGKFIAWNTSETNDWLTVSASSAGENTWFNMVNLGENDSYFELKEGLVRVEVSERLNNFWNKKVSDNGAYHYFPEFQASQPPGLELILVKKKEGNLSAAIEDGDIVAFRDKMPAGGYHYLQVSDKDNAGLINLDGSTREEAEQFEVHLHPGPVESWK